MRVFEASVSEGVVSANGGVVINCPILGEGGDSSGYLVMSESDLVYLPKISPDVKSLINLLETLCDKINEITVICAAPASPSSVPVNVADITAVKTDLTTLKDALK